MTQEVNEKYDQLILNLDKNNPTYLSRKYSYELRRERDLDSVKTIEEHKIRQGKKRTFYEIDQKIKNAVKLKTTKLIVDFCAEEAVSTNTFAVKEKQEVQVTTVFLLGKKC